MSDPKVEAARIEVERSRAQLLDTAKLLQQRLQPGKLSRDAWESAKMKGADLAEDAVDAAASGPMRRAAWSRHWRCSLPGSR